VFSEGGMLTRNLVGFGWAPDLAEAVVILGNGLAGREDFPPGIMSTLPRLGKRQTKFIVHLGQLEAKRDLIRPMVSVNPWPQLGHLTGQESSSPYIGYYPEVRFVESPRTSGRAP
jgi:hypothetical protein